MPGISRMRPQGEVHVVHVPPGFRPKTKPADGRDEVLFSREDQKTFRVDKILGVGAFGTAAKIRVIKSDEKFTKGETIVIKQVRIENSKDRIRMQEEYSIGRRLGNHENIVQMFALMPDCYDGTGKRCERLFMRFCNAGTLHKIMNVHIRQGKHFPEDFLWHVMKGLGWALARMHNGLRKEVQLRSPAWTGFVHYDLKPDNILLDWSSSSRSKYPTPKIADFGCSGRIGRTPKWRGHLLYLSPEVRNDDFRPCMSECDIWALGLTMYELMEFKMAFPEFKSRDGISLDYNRFRGWKTGYSDRLRNLVNSCLDFDYHKRPDAEQIIRRCEEYQIDVRSGRERSRPWGYPKLLMDRPS